MLTFPFGCVGTATHSLHTITGGVAGPNHAPVTKQMPQEDKSVYHGTMKCSEIEEKHKKFVRDNPEVLAGLEPFLPDSMTSSSSSSMRPSAPDHSESTAAMHSPPTPSVHHQALYGTNSSAREYIVDTINSLPEEMVEEILLKVQRKMPGIMEEGSQIDVDEEDDQATEQPRRRCRQQ